MKGLEKNKRDERQDLVIAGVQYLQLVMKGSLGGIILRLARLLYSESPVYSVCSLENPNYYWVLYKFTLRLDTSHYGSNTYNQTFKT